MQFSIPRQRNGLRSAGELAAGRPHGDRLKYMAGCRCMLCRAANARYECERAAARRRGEWNGLVDAGRVRDHLENLSLRGIGRDTVADLTGLSSSTLDLYRTGKRRKIRALNEKKILAIDANAVLHGAQLVNARETWQRIRWMLKEGFTKAEIARRLGYKREALQLNKKLITARNAMKIERLYNRLRAGDPDLEV